MANPNWGTKRTCPQCGAHFYDLQKNPALCPKCSHAFDPNVVAKPKRGRGGRKAELATTDENEDILLKRKKSLGGEDDADVEVENFESDIEEIEDIDDLAAIEEEIEGIDDLDETATGDDGDDESIIEVLDAGEDRLIDDIGDEDEEEK